MLPSIDLARLGCYVRLGQHALVRKGFRDPFAYSVEAQDRLLDLFSATASEAAIDADASEPGLFKNP